MTQISLTEAQEHLPEIIASLQPGEAVEIIQGDRAIARLIVESLNVRQPRKPGSAIGSLTILAEDEAHLEGFEDYTQHTVQSLEFRGPMLLLTVDGQTYEIAIAEASARLAQASESDRNHYRIAPSGYGIHWPTLDEDLSINGLIKLASSAQAIAG